MGLINIILVKSPRVNENPPNFHVEAVCLLPPYVVGPGNYEFTRDLERHSSFVKSLYEFTTSKYRKVTIIKVVVD